MELNLTRIFISLGFSLIIAGLLLSAVMPSKVYAADLELIGSELGLEIIPESEKLFDLTNLNPGDAIEANLTIKNKYIAPFELFMKTERMGIIPQDDDADLFKQLVLTVYLGDKEIYSGSMMNFATSNISLGKFGLNDTKKLRAIVHLLGPESGNEFQGKNVDVKWIFIAQVDKPMPEEPKDPALPKTGEVSSMIFYGIGIGLLGLGIGIGRKKKR